MFAVDLTKTIEQLTDDELAEAVNLAELLAAAKGEQERRCKENDQNASRAQLCTPSVTVRTEASCPTCGKNDSFSMTRILYSSWEAGQNGERPVRAVACSCGTWYNAGTGERMEPDEIRKMFSY